MRIASHTRMREKYAPLLFHGLPLLGNTWRIDNNRPIRNSRRFETNSRRFETNRRRNGRPRGPGDGAVVVVAVVVVKVVESVEVLLVVLLLRVSPVLNARPRFQEQAKEEEEPQQAEEGRAGR
jgi:hypothetical protein